MSERDELKKRLANLTGDPSRQREANEVRKRLVDLDLAEGKKPEPVTVGLEPLKLNAKGGLN